ncbi:MAG: hypothetical protein WCJ37_03375 [Syntrophus sp. (in: bacteria)]
MQNYDLNKIKAVTIGYYDDNAVYLLPGETWHELQKFCIQEGTYFPFTKTTFFRILKDRRLIEPSKKGEPTSQKKIHGKNERVLKLVGGGICEFFATSVTEGTSR